MVCGGILNKDISLLYSCVNSVISASNKTTDDIVSVYQDNFPIHQGCTGPISLHPRQGSCKFVDEMLKFARSRCSKRDGYFSISMALKLSNLCQYR